MINRPAAEKAASQHEDQAAADAVPDDLAAAAGHLRGHSEHLREQADLDRAAAGELVNTARQEAARITGEAEAAARVLSSGATAAERQASAMEEKAQHLAAAAEQKTHGEAAVQRAGALAAERETVTAQVAGLDRRLGQLGEEEQALATQLAAATQAADVDAIVALGTRGEAVQAACRALGDQRKAVQGRLDQIGDGSVDSAGELERAIRDARGHVSAMEEALNEAYPDRPEAVAARLQKELRLTLEANLERIADEGRAAKRPQQQQIVHL